MPSYMERPLTKYEKELSGFEKGLVEKYLEMLGCLEPEHWNVVKGILRRKDKPVVLDLGISPNWEYIVNRAEKCREIIGYNGIELSKELMEIVKINLEKYPRSDPYHEANFIYADAKYIPYRKYSADVVLACGLLDQLIGKESSSEPYKWDRNKESVLSVIREAHRVLNPWGILVASNDIEKQPIGEFKELVREYFEEVEVILGKEKRYLAICEKPKLL